MSRFPRIPRTESFTVTFEDPDALAVLDRALDRFFCHSAPLDAGDTLLVAFSGGPDSLALLVAAARFQRRQNVRVLAAHLDHGLDSDSPRRAQAARRSAAELEIPCFHDRRLVTAERGRGESLEAAARRVRYRFLTEVGAREGARWIATAHHRDDQVETVLLRLAQGSGWQGLAGILPVRRLVSDLAGRAPGIVRPLLDLSREDLQAAVRALGLAALEDPTNSDLSVPRNRLRHQVLPRLEARWSGLGTRLAELARNARLARISVQRRLARVAEVQAEESRDGTLASASREVLVSLANRSPELLPVALATLHRAAGLPHPPSRRAMNELERQLGRVPFSATGVDGGDGLRWEERGGRLLLRIGQAGSSVRLRFAYTLQIPGELIIEEIGVGFRVTRGPVAPWMFLRSTSRAGLALPVREGDRVEIRNRRPGDRMQSLGAPGHRRLKEILIDRRVPRQRRERLPLLVVGGHIAWVPGVAVGERFRLPREGDETSRARSVWIAEIFEPSGSRRPWPAGQEESERGRSSASESTRTANRFESEHEPR